MVLRDRAIGAFLDGVASEAVTPSGGAVAAVVGASGAALCEMVCLHTIDRDGYGDVESQLVAVGERLARDRRRLLALADEDVTAVETMQASGGGDSGLPSDQTVRAAIAPPLETAERSLDVLDRGRVVVAEGTDRATADAMTGALLAHAALQSSVGTVRANLSLIESETVVSETSGRVDELETAGQTALEKVRTAGPEQYTGRRNP